MPAPPTPKNRLATALHYARYHRHHPDCRCGEYRNAAGEPFCTREEANWSSMLDRILTTVCREEVS